MYRFMKLLLVLAFCAIGAQALAQDYPAKPLRLVVGYAAGGPTDYAGRLIAKELSHAVGQQVVVENIPSNGGIVGAQDVLNSPRDGYTLQLCIRSLGLATLVQSNLPFKMSDFAPISPILKFPFFVVVPADAPFSNLAEFVAYAKEHPGELNYGYSGLVNQIEIARLLKTLGIEMVGAAYKGDNEILVDLLAGRLHLAFQTPNLAVAQVSSGKLKAIGLASDERLDGLPDVPTLVEQGTDFTSDVWFGLCVADGVPQPVIDYLSDKTLSVLNSKTYQDEVAKIGGVPLAMSPAEFGKMMSDDIAESSEMVKSLGISR